MRNIKGNLLAEMSSAHRLLLAAAMLMCVSFSAQAQEQRIVGLGATTCSQFTSDALKNPAVQRDYLAWAQGYMSAILLTRPGTVDNGLNLAPTTFPLLKQLEFLRHYCASHPDEGFADAIDKLYKRLREELIT